MGQKWQCAFAAGLRPDLAGELHHSSDPLAGLKGAYLGMGKPGWNGIVRGEEGRKRRGKDAATSVPTHF